LLVGALVAIVVVAIAAPFIYIHFIEGPAPARLSLPSHSATTAVGSDGTTAVSVLSGTYHVGSGSQAGYRVSEVLIGQHATAVGRTSKIWGSITIQGDDVITGIFSVDMASVVSDQSERNAQFDGRIMDVARFPTSTLKLTAPIALGSPAPLGSKDTYSASGALTLHGETRTVRFSITTERTSGGIFALADLPIVFADWNIANPSVGGLVTTASSGTLEVLVHLTTGPGNPAASGSASPSTNGGGPPTQITVPKTTIPKITIPNG
jgi:polyisoprenoid-binding protein YceI